GSSSRRSYVDSTTTTTTTTDLSLSSSASSVSSYATPHKPHKASQAEWESIRRARAARAPQPRPLPPPPRLGTGDLGSVYLCQLALRRRRVSLRHEGGGPRPRRAQEAARAEAEREILRHLDHPFLPTLYAEFDAAHYSCLVMEYCPGGDLHVARQRQSTRCFCVSAASGGDDDDDDDDDGVVETELVAEPVAARSKSFVGTHEYLAPEVISGAGHGSAVDWWTLGVFLYEMIYGRTPFKGENNEKTLINIMKQPLRFPKINTTNAKDLEDESRAQDLISRLLVKNPKRRIGSLKGSVEIKRHGFFKGVNWALIRSVKPPEVPRSDNVIIRRSGRSNCKAPVPVQKLTKKERDEPYHIPQYIDYF
ncbi:Protein kinase PINOID 2, partial [Ananas comosus]